MPRSQVMVTKHFMKSTAKRNSKLERSHRMPALVGILVTSCFPALLPAAEPADLVLRGGKVVTLDDRQPEAGAIALRGDRIAAVGTAAEVQPLIGPATRIIDLAGRMAMPGFIEGHGHFLSLGDSKRKLDLSRAESWEEIVALV